MDGCRVFGEPLAGEALRQLAGTRSRLGLRAADSVQPPLDVVRRIDKRQPGFLREPNQEQSRLAECFGLTTDRRLQLPRLRAALPQPTLVAICPVGKHDEFAP